MSSSEVTHIAVYANTEQPDEQSGKYLADTKGCILVGERFCDYIIKSRIAMTELLKLFRTHENETHHITIQ